jgi:hypothetical protein
MSEYFEASVRRYGDYLTQTLKFSPLGVHQIIHAQIITSADDRKTLFYLLAEAVDYIVTPMVKQNAFRGPHHNPNPKPVPVGKFLRDHMQRVIKASGHPPISELGLKQIAESEIVTKEEDRKALLVYLTGVKEDATPPPAPKRDSRGRIRQ